MSNGRPRRRGRRDDSDDPSGAYRYTGSVDGKPAYRRDPSGLRISEVQLQQREARQDEDVSFAFSRRRQSSSTRSSKSSERRDSAPSPSPAPVEDEDWDQSVLRKRRGARKDRPSPSSPSVRSSVSNSRSTAASSSSTASSPSNRTKERTTVTERTTVSNSRSTTVSSATTASPFPTTIEGVGGRPPRVPSTTRSGASEASTPRANNLTPVRTRLNVRTDAGLGSLPEEHAQEGAATLHPPPPPPAEGDEAKPSTSRRNGRKKSPPPILPPQTPTSHVAVQEGLNNIEPPVKFSMSRSRGRSKESASPSPSADSLHKVEPPVKFSMSRSRVRSRESASPSPSADSLYNKVASKMIARTSSKERKRDQSKDMDNAKEMLPPTPKSLGAVAVQEGRNNIQERIGSDRGESKGSGSGSGAGSGFNSSDQDGSQNAVGKLTLGLRMFIPSVVSSITGGNTGMEPSPKSEVDYGIDPARGSFDLVIVPKGSGGSGGKGTKKGRDDRGGRKAKKSKDRPKKWEDSEFAKHGKGNSEDVPVPDELTASFSPSSGSSVSSTLKVDRWSTLSVRAALAVMSAGGSEEIAQRAADAVIAEGKKKDADTAINARELATRVSVAVLEGGGSHRVAAGAAVAIMNDLGGDKMSKGRAEGRKVKRSGSGSSHGSAGSRRRRKPPQALSPGVVNVASTMTDTRTVDASMTPSLVSQRRRLEEKEAEVERRQIAAGEAAQKIHERERAVAEKERAIKEARDRKESEARAWKEAEVELARMAAERAARETAKAAKAAAEQATKEAEEVWKREDLRRREEEVERRNRELEERLAKLKKAEAQKVAAAEERKREARRVIEEEAKLRELQEREDQLKKAEAQKAAMEEERKREAQRKREALRAVELQKKEEELERRNRQLEERLVEIRKEEKEWEEQRERKIREAQAQAKAQAQDQAQSKVHARADGLPQSEEEIASRPVGIMDRIVASFSSSKASGLPTDDATSEASRRLQEQEEAMVRRNRALEEAARTQLQKEQDIRRRMEILNALAAREANQREAELRSREEEEHQRALRLREDDKRRVRQERERQLARLGREMDEVTEANRRKETELNDRMEALDAATKALLERAENVQRQIDERRIGPRDEVSSRADDRLGSPPQSEEFSLDISTARDYYGPQQSRPVEANHSNPQFLSPAKSEGSVFEKLTGKLYSMFTCDSNVLVHRGVSQDSPNSLVGAPEDAGGKPTSLFHDPPQIESPTLSALTGDSQHQRQSPWDKRLNHTGARGHPQADPGLNWDKKPVSGPNELLNEALNRAIMQEAPREKQLDPGDYVGSPDEMLQQALFSAVDQQRADERLKENGLMTLGTYETLERSTNDNDPDLVGGMESESRTQNAPNPPSALRKGGGLKSKLRVRFGSARSKKSPTEGDSAAPRKPRGKMSSPSDKLHRRESQPGATEEGKGQMFSFSRKRNKLVQV